MEGTQHQDLVERARMFAYGAHEAIGQCRKYSGEPYIVHPAEVASIVEHAGGDSAMVAAAWLHDVVEDTHVTLKTIRMVFGQNVHDLVKGMTDVSQPEDGNRATRKAMDREHMAQQSARCHTIKLADLISNTRDITVNDPAFAKVYREEARLLLPILADGDQELLKHATDQLIS